MAGGHPFCYPGVLATPGIKRRDSATPERVAPRSRVIPLYHTAGLKHEEKHNPGNDGEDREDYGGFLQHFPGVGHHPADDV